MGVEPSSAAVIKNLDYGAHHDASPHDLSYAPLDHAHGEGGTPPLRPCGLFAH
jgi:hypothetical protein